MASRKLFGTDGIRGKANTYPMTCEVAMQLGRAVTHYFQAYGPHTKRPVIVLGKDTRLSCYMLELAFAAGVCSQGGKVVQTGPLPTPGVAFATSSMRATAGVMISASHNSYSDNGIKIFDGQGNKLPDDVEKKLEEMVLNPELVPIRESSQLGNAKRLDEIFGRYIVHVKSNFDYRYNLDDMRVVVDCANGAGYKVAPMIFEELGAEVFTLGVEPNGQNINLNCGSLSPEAASLDVRKYKADLGLCLDGDADRATMIDHEGNIVHGDRLIGLFSKLLLDRGVIKPGNEIVGTVMSNLGLENYIKSLGLNFSRTKVGDRYILERMKATGAKLGGEPSGHVVFADHSKTGDGILVALKAIECIKHYKKSLKELTEGIPLFPQITKNASIKQKLPLDQVDSIQKAVKKAEKELGSNGRVLVRYSGTEPLARVMVEGQSEDQVDRLCDELVNVLTKELS